MPAGTESELNELEGPIHGFDGSDSTKKNVRLVGSKCTENMDAPCSRVLFGAVD
jgi:hypothetical protein